MKVLIFSSLLLVSISASLLEEQETKFQAFKLKHGKTYLNQAEEVKRFNIFNDNVRAIEDHNVLYELGKVSYKKGINRFTDMTQAEFKSMLTLSSSKKPTLVTTPHVKSGLDFPTSVDWREKGQVTKVKDQGLCQSGWAYSITGTTEAAYYRDTGNLISLSAQQLVDCTTNVNHGCSGGDLEETLKYVIQYGLQSETSYPFKGEEQQCKYNTSDVISRIHGFYVIYPDEYDILDVIANIGPVAVAIDATYLKTYESGIFDGTDCSTSDLNHAVLIVGYGTQNGTNFWIVKNSWGEDFGEEGYFRIVRGKNECGITKDAVYPSVHKPKP